MKNKKIAIFIILAIVIVMCFGCSPLDVEQRSYYFSDVEVSFSSSCTVAQKGLVKGNAAQLYNTSGVTFSSKNSYFSESSSDEEALSIYKEFLTQKLHSKLSSLQFTFVDNTTISIIDTDRRYVRNLTWTSEAGDIVIYDEDQSDALLLRPYGWDLTLDLKELPSSLNPLSPQISDFLKVVLRFKVKL